MNRFGPSFHHSIGLEEYYNYASVEVFNRIQFERVTGQKPKKNRFFGGDLGLTPRYPGKKIARFFLTIEYDRGMVWLQADQI